MKGREGHREIIVLLRPGCDKKREREEGKGLEKEGGASREEKREQKNGGRGGGARKDHVYPRVE